MQELYAKHGIRFRYPDDWALSEEQPRDQEISITVESPETSFWWLVLFYDRPHPDRVLQTVVDAFREDYEEIDVYDVETRLSDHSCRGCDIEFVSLELINSAFLRSFRTARFTVFVLYQATDHELRETRATLEGIGDSLQCEPDNDETFL